MNSSNGSFAGKTVLITGAGRGLGRAYALAFARRGAHVVVNDIGATAVDNRLPSKLADEVVADIRALGAEAIANYDSVAHEVGAQSIVRAAISAFGTIDILIKTQASPLASRSTS